MPPRFFQMLWNHADVGEDGHEVGITRPARDNVHVKMISDSRSGSNAEINADVESVRSHGFLKNLPCKNKKTVHFKGFRLVQL